LKLLVVLISVTVEVVGLPVGLRAFGIDVGRESLGEGADKLLKVFETADCT
jgi:hypothetical protein